MRAPIVAALGLVVVLVAPSASAQVIASQTSSQPFPGVELVQGRLGIRPSDFFAAKISLCADGVAIDATEAPSQLTTPRAWAQAVGAQLAVNGDFFVDGPRVHGQAVGNGQPWPLGQTGADPAAAGLAFYQKYGWIAFGPDWVEFDHTRYVKDNPAEYGGIAHGFRPTEVTHDLPAGTLALVSGYPELVTEGRVYPCDPPDSALCWFDRADLRRLNPRTAMGLSEDRRTFILAVVDGRSATSAGAYGTDMAQLMAELGAWQAFNLDGGGSSAMWLDGQGVLNVPSDGAPRPTANHWGVFATGAGPARSCLPVAPGSPDAGPSSGDAGEQASGDAGAGSGAGLGGGCATGGASSATAGVLLVGLALGGRRRRPRA